MSLEGKALYVASYIKQLAVEKSGAKHIDKSVYDEVQEAIQRTLARGFTVKNGKAFLNSAEVPLVPAEEPAAPEPASKPKSEVKRLKGTPYGGVFGSGNPPVVIVRVADGTVISSHSDIDVTVVDIDRVGRMCGNRAYDLQVGKVVSALRKVGRPVEGFDCKGFADLLEEMHEDRR